MSVHRPRWFAAGVQRTLRRYGWELRRVPGVSHPLDAAPHLRLGFSLEHLLAYLAERMSDVCFMQIGAYDGVTTDVLGRFVRKHDWAGVLVEPQPEAFAKLRETYRGYPRVALENVAVAEENGSRTMFRIRPDRLDGLPPWAAQTATLQKETLVAHSVCIADIEDRIETRTVPCMTVATLLERTKLPRLDLVVIDTEGYDGRILRMMDIGRHRPLAICYEHMHLPPAEQRACLELLIHHDYRVAELQYDTIALREPAAS